MHKPIPPIPPASSHLYEHFAPAAWTPPPGLCWALGSGALLALTLTMGQGAHPAASFMLLVLAHVSGWLGSNGQPAWIRGSGERVGGYGGGHKEWEEGVSLHHCG